MTTPARTSRSAPDTFNILVVDDMEENLVALSAVLGPLGQRIVTAHSGEEALKAMLREEFVVVLLDILMPGMDGFETAGNIKRLDQTKDVPIILLTGADVDPDYTYRGYAVGAADFLVKPIDPWVLRTKVSVFLELHRKNRQLTIQTEQLRRLVVADQGDGTGYHERLTEICRRLGQIESLLGEEDGADSGALADRIAALEEAVHDLPRPPTPAPGPDSAPDPDSGAGGGAGTGTAAGKDPGASEAEGTRRRDASDVRG